MVGCGILSAMRSIGCFALFFAACAAPAAIPKSPTEVSPPPPSPSALMSDPAEYSIAHPTEEAGAAIFSRTGVGDPYRTGLPYPLFLALLAAYPDELGPDAAAFTTRFGFTPRAHADADGADAADRDRDRDEHLPLGMHLTTDPNTRIPFVVTNCALCHADVVRWPGGEQLVLGLGNKRIRIHAYDDALARVAARPDFDRAHLAPLALAAAQSRKIAWPPEWRDAVLDETLRALKARTLTRAKFLARVRDGLPGRVATIEAFALALGLQLGRELTPSAHVGWAKIPDVIGFAQKRTLSWDGGAEGSPDVLVVDADIAAGARIEWLWKHPWQGPSVAAFLRHLPRQLPFPARVDAALASRGRTLFEKSCARCHGTYGADGRAQNYLEHVVPLMQVETDPARAESPTDDFVAAANDPKLDGGLHLVRTRRTSGYVPPVLTSVWARAPYGHAGQWPTLAVLAMKPEERPVKFVVHSAAPIDLVKVGLQWEAAGSGASAGAKLGDGDYWWDGGVIGFGVGGHPFLANLSEAERAAVLEYLKTL